jgi:hypothetical protein
MCSVEEIKMRRPVSPVLTTQPKRHNRNPLVSPSNNGDAAPITFPPNRGSRIRPYPVYFRYETKCPPLERTTISSRFPLPHFTTPQPPRQRLVFHVVPGSDTCIVRSYRLANVLPSRPMSVRPGLLGFDRSSIHRCTDIPFCVSG